jgi:hypothetical protein
LVQAYYDATLEFSERVAALNARIGIMQRKAYELPWSSVEDARLKSEQARFACEGQVADHGC